MLRVFCKDMLIYVIGSVDIDRGSKLYADLVQAQQSLVVANHLHLLYLSTPYDMVSDVKPNWMIYLHEASERAALCAFQLCEIISDFLCTWDCQQLGLKKLDHAQPHRLTAWRAVDMHVTVTMTCTWRLLNSDDYELACQWRPWLVLEMLGWTDASDELLVYSTLNTEFITHLWLDSRIAEYNFKSTIKKSATEINNNNIELRRYWQ